MIFDKIKKAKNRKVTNLPRLYEGQRSYCNTFRDFAEYFGSTFSQENAFILKEKNKATKDVHYIHITYSEFLSEIRAFACILREEGYLEKPVVVTGKNSYEWLLVYYSVLYAGGIIVPLDKDVPVDEAVSSIKRSGAATMFYHKKNQKFADAVDIESFDMDEIKNFVERGMEKIASGSTAHIKESIQPDQDSIIIFTSGTSASSKAVILSQENVLSNAYDAATTEPFYAGEINMAFLPFHHTFGATAQAILLWCGVTTVFCDGLKYIKKNFVEYGVSIFVGVPALIDAIYRQIIKGVEKKGKEKEFAKGLVISNSLRKVGLDKRRSIFKDIINELGGNLRLIISGASAADPDVLENMNNIGITIVQGYGLTETSPILSAETPEIMRKNSVGKAFPSVKLKINEPDEEGIGELLAKGEGIMKGYLDNPDATEEAFIDGWFNTGDLAYIDDENFVFIKGRKKNVIVLKNGKNVFPEELEDLVNDLPFVDEVMVYGEPKASADENGPEDLVVTCKIVYNTSGFEDLGAETEEDYQRIAKEEIEKINDQLAPHQLIRRIHLSDEPMIKTSTGKIKRYKEIEKTRKVR